MVVPPEAVPGLVELFTRYSACCTEIAAYGRDNRESNSIRLHHALYRQMRVKYSLPANLVVTALRRVSGTLKVAKLKGKFLYKPTFVCLDERTFSLFRKDWTVSFSTHTGRFRAPLSIGDYQREALGSVDIKSATLVRAQNGFFINIVVETDVPDAQKGGVLGVDLGIRNIAVTSSGRKFDGKSIRQYREHRWKIRASLQSNGTKGARRTLKRLSGREARHAAWVNHNIAKSIVLEAIKTGCGLIAFEDLEGIRNRLRVPNRHRNRMMSLWSFFQIRGFVRYKAAFHGIRVLEVDPAYSSQTCSRCGSLGVRDREKFACTTCGETADADVNAAKVIAARGAAVNRPESNGKIKQVLVS